MGASARRLPSCRLDGVDPQHGESIEAAVVDVQDAYLIVPSDPRERRFLATAIARSRDVSARARVFVPYSPPFGLRSAQLVWGRFAAFLGRSGQAVADGAPSAHGPDSASPATRAARGRIEIYVDDPIILVAGTAAARQRLLAAVLWWWVVVGAPLAWAKAQRGAQVTWIGAMLVFSSSLVELCLTQERALFLGTEAKAMQERNVAPIKRAQKFAATGSWACGITPAIAPFIRQVWAALATAQSGRISRSKSARRCAGFRPCA